MSHQPEANKEFKFKPGKKMGAFAKLNTYKELMVGEKGFFFFILVEGCQMFIAPIPGALGILLRSIAYRLIFGKIEKGVIINRNVSLRHPHKIRIGRGSVIDENVLLDAKGTENTGIIIGSDVFIGRNSILSCKNGNITIEEKANIGFNCEVFSSSSVVVGPSTIIAAYCYLVGGGSYHMDLKSIPMSAFPDFVGKGGITIGSGAWLGAHVVVLDGVIVGEDTAVAAGSVVTKTANPLSVYGGVPAKKLKER